MKVALIYDFDGTLAAGNMQEYAFIPALGKSSEEFWQASNELAEAEDADPILTYMWLMLSEARRAGIAITRKMLMSAGSNIEFFAGVREWFSRINEYAASKGLELLHYINSSGIKEIIEGTEIACEFRNIYACSYLYDEYGEACWAACSVNYTNKTQFMFKISKGVERVSDAHQVNCYISDRERPVPFSRMIYIGDGTTDIPCMRLVKQQGGHSIAVYDPTEEKGELMRELVCHERVSHVCPADYSIGSPLDVLVKTIIDKIANDLRLQELVYNLR